MTIVPPERWLPVPSWEGRYEVSDLGRVRSLRHNGGIRQHPLLLKLKPGTPDGRLVVNLYCGSPRKQVTRLVHHLVLEAFIGPRPDGQEARHGPGGMLDNRLANLCWGTHSENVGQDKVRDGTHNRGEQHPLSRLSEVDIAEIRRRGAAGESQRSIARYFRLSQSHVSRIIRRRAWSHVE